MITRRAVLPREQRLRKTSDFQTVYKRGRSYVHSAMVLYVLKREGESVRIGFSVSKKLGGAVTRNRIKRRLRSASARLIPRLVTGADAVIVARKPCADAAVNELKSIIENLIRKARELD